MKFPKFFAAAAVAGTLAVSFSVPARADWRYSGHRYNGGGYSHYHGHYYGHHHGDAFAAAVILGALIGMAVDNQASRTAYYYPAPPVVYRSPPRVVYRVPPPTVYQVPPPATVYQAPTVASAAPSPSSCVMEREYQTTVTIGGKPRQAYGTACLRSDGSWLQGPAKLVPEF